MNIMGNNEILTKEAFEDAFYRKYLYEDYHETSKINSITKNSLGRRITNVFNDVNFLNCKIK